MKRLPLQRGFTLVEALMALVLASVGLLAIARLQVALTADGADTLRQTEGMALARAKLEDLKLSLPAAWAAMPAGTELVPGNGQQSFTRTWNTVSSGVPAQRISTVTVSWTDRGGQTRSAQATGLLPRTDGDAAVRMAYPLVTGKEIKGPVNRSIDILLGATSVGDGRSTVKLSVPVLLGLQDVTYVMDDSTGKVVQRCTGSPSGTQLINGTATCVPYNAYTVAGYVSGASTSLLGVALNPLGIDTSKVTGWDNSGGKKIECEYRKAAGVNDPSLLAFIADFSSIHSYVCVIPMAANATGWSGKLLLTGLVPTTLNLVSLLSVNVCRFQYPVADNPNPNRRNVQPYAQVTEPLLNQNYLLDSDGGSCPTVNGLALTVHQQCTVTKTLLGLLIPDSNPDCPGLLS